MRYKTTIEIVTEAADKNEAMEVAGEYLAGNIVSGVKMKCATRPIITHKKILCASATILLVGAAGLFAALRLNSPQNLTAGISAIGAIQPPLKTSSEERKDSDFKEEWQAKHTRQTLNFIKK